MSTVEIFNPIHGKWTKSSPMRTLRSRVGVSVLNGLLYAIGGYNGTERLDTVEIFNPTEKKWKVVAPLSCPRRYVTLRLVPTSPRLHAVSWHLNTM